MIAVNNQTVGQPLILQCSVTTIRDINSRVDLVWISDDTELERVEGVTSESSTNNLAVYTDYYIIPQLSITDNNSLYTCEVIINRSPLISASSNFTLYITGNYVSYSYIKHFFLKIISARVSLSESVSIWNFVS